jgi:hypothetical protein
LWDVSSVTDMTSMFEGATAFSACNYSKTLKGWATLEGSESLQSSVDFYGSDNGYYSFVESYRDVLDTDYSWTITDGGSITSVTINSIVDSDGDDAYINVVFSDDVYSDTSQTTSLVTSNFIVSINGGVATLNSTRPLSVTQISTTEYQLELDLNGIVDGSEVVSVYLASDESVYDSSGNGLCESYVSQSVTLAGSILPDFITTWETTSDGETIGIPLYSRETYSFDIDWGDDSSVETHSGTGSSLTVEHDYTTA